MKSLTALVIAFGLAASGAAIAADNTGNALAVPALSKAQSLWEPPINREIRPRARVLGLSRAPARQPEQNRARALKIVFREKGQPQNRGRTTAKKTSLPIWVVPPPATRPAEPVWSRAPRARAQRTRISAQQLSCSRASASVGAPFLPCRAAYPKAGAVTSAISLLIVNLG